MDQCPAIGLAVLATVMVDRVVRAMWSVSKENPFQGQRGLRRTIVQPLRYLHPGR